VIHYGWLSMCTHVPDDVGFKRHDRGQRVIRREHQFLAIHPPEAEIAHLCVNGAEGRLDFEEGIEHLSISKRFGVVLIPRDGQKCRRTVGMCLRPTVEF
jgi:hypothetical protein